ncbi:hypothetical protein BD626DRAFT_25711 [Schizophyllum amplum]|uniref:BHLH domain-containing protein n=1 Tax=Schizophyllum amplum TaxID=97359 RepID=A0A550CZM6_9AGAR|nr:hypothetical protein BD626DRAFT_25711 [Auriculariopsis ampla]
MSSHSGPNSPSSSDESLPPQTPISPEMNATLLADKRKASRRSNTAERRATHNAVERQRRETLNGRFLDLAALLPNLSQIRRPSKSAIVNSSIAHISAARRHRLLAARELRLLKLEADALRRELNEWRHRQNLPTVEEPPRSEAFGMVLTGELEVIPEAMGDDDEDDEYFEQPQQQQQYQRGPDPRDVARLTGEYNNIRDMRQLQAQQQLEHAQRLAMLKAGMLKDKSMYSAPLIASPSMPQFEHPHGFDLNPMQQAFIQQQELGSFNNFSDKMFDNKMTFGDAVEAKLFANSEAPVFLGQSQRQMSYGSGRGDEDALSIGSRGSSSGSPVTQEFNMGGRGSFEGRRLTVNTSLSGYNGMSGANAGMVGGRGDGLYSMMM